MVHRNRLSSASPDTNRPGAIRPGLYMRTRKRWGCGLFFSWLGPPQCGLVPSFSLTGSPFEPTAPDSRIAAFRAATLAARRAEQAAAPPAPRNGLHRITCQLIDKKNFDHG